VHGQDALVFLLSLGLILGVARLLGEAARAFGLPLVVGELLTGLLLGATGLQRVLPGVHAWLFPTGAPAEMLSGYTTVAVVLLLVVAGLEVDLGIVRRRGKSALVVAALGIVMPLAGGLVLGYLVPDSVVGAPDHRGLFAIFMGVALSISALPVVAKTLLDLGLFKTDVGLLVMTVAMLDDLIGWVAFSVLLGPMQGGGIELGVLVRTIVLATGFALLCLIPGRRVIDRVLAAIEQNGELAPGRVPPPGPVAEGAMCGAAVTQAIGGHAVLGGFVVGVAFGDSPRLRERTRQTIHQFVTNVFAPVFFASVALHVDFVANFDPVLCLVVFLVATAAKLIGCAGGARFTGLPWRESLAVGFGLNARGAMEILLALLAREAKVINDSVFVALVTMAIATSLLAGPSMKRLLYPSAGRGGIRPDDGAPAARRAAPAPSRPSPRCSSASSSRRRASATTSRSRMQQSKGSRSRS